MTASNRERYRLGTRHSPLARTQSKMIADQIYQLTGVEVDLVDITTEGDINRKDLVQIGGTGVFVSAVRDALHNGSVDIAVHSLKDLPTAPEAGLRLAATPLREDVRDVLIARDGLTLEQLPVGATVGTGSPRRAVQLKALGLGLEPVSIRGNIHTRLGKVSSGECDAVLLAAAGLRRLGLLDPSAQLIDPGTILPAPGQGSLAVEIRDNEKDTRLIAALAQLDDADTRASVIAERSVLSHIEAGCAAPVGALADVTEGEDGTELYLRAVYENPDSGRVVKGSITGPIDKAFELGGELAADLLDKATVAGSSETRWR